MKKRQNNSARASALQIILCLALAFTAAILLASTFKAASGTSYRPGPAVPNSTGLMGPYAIPGAYATLAAAIADLNTFGVAGPVTFNVSANQTAPSGGYVIGGTGSAILVGGTATNSTNTVIIQGVGGPIIFASAAQAVGSVNDAIFKLIGADWITIRAFVMQEDPANTTATPAASNNMTEWGVALLHVDTADGAQNNSILDNTISLNRTYTNTFGVYSNNRHSATVVGVAENVVNSTTGPASGNKVYNNAISDVNVGIAFVGTSTAANMDVGNDIGGSIPANGNVITNWGSGAAPITTYASVSIGQSGILVNEQTGLNCSNNTVTSAALASGALVVRGVHGDFNPTSPAGTFTNNLNNNTVTLTSSGTAQLQGVVQINTGGSAVAGMTLNMNSNTYQNSAVTAVGAGTLFGIANTGAFGTVNMNLNTIKGNTSAATTGGFTGISNSGTVQTAISISDNNVGMADSGAGAAATFSAATSGAITGISCATPLAAATMSIQNNNVQGIVQSVAGTNAHTYLTFTHGASGADIVNNNTFTNLTANTSGSVTFMNRGTTSMTATGSLAVTNNRIVTAFNKLVAGGTVTGFTNGGGASSPNGSTILDNLNNFSNITCVGATAVLLWSNADGPGGGSGPTKTITNNTFNNITTGGTSQITGITFNFSGNGTTVSNNTLSNLTGGGVILALSSGTSNSGASETISNNTFTNFTAGGQINALQTGLGAITTGNITGNTISNLTSSSAAANPIFPMIVSGFATTTNISRNRICNVETNGNALPATVLFGMLVQTGGTTYNISNNLIGDLRMPNASATGAAAPGPNQLEGLAVGFGLTAATTVNAYFNTIYLNNIATTGADFGSGAMSVNNTVPTVVLNDNIFYNTSAATGAGVTAAYRRGDATLASYGASSNNNLFWSPAGNVYYDGITPIPGLVAYQALVAARDSASISANPGFTSTTCGDARASFLHITNGSPAFHTGAPAGGILTDYDGDIRDTTTPDIGADEVFSFAGTSLSVNKTADAATVTAGCTIIGYTVTLSNNLAPTATGLTFTDVLPAASGVSWSINPASAGWSISGSNLVYSPTTLAGNSMTTVHVESSTTTSSCGVLNNTASFTSSNGGSGSSGPISITVLCPTSCSTGIILENFDGVAAPALPAGWTAVNAVGVAPLWVTSTAVVDSAPNAAFVDDPGSPSDKRLDSPPYTIANAGTQLSFRNNYNTELNWDGGVLEIKVGCAGAFTDIIAAGGSFATGGYSSTINTADPISGATPRPAWTGTSGGFITTTVNLPAAATGQNVVFRWRSGSDPSVSGTGWRIDDVQLFCDGGAPTPTASPTPTPTPTPSPSPTPTPVPTPTPTPCPMSTTILSQDFESGLGAWTTGNTSTTTGVGNVALAAWTVRTNPHTPGATSTETFSSGGGTSFIISNSDVAGSGVTVNTTLMSPAINTVGLTTFRLSYRHYFRWLSGTSNVEISTTGAAGPWTSVKAYSSLQGGPVGNAAPFVADSIVLDGFSGLDTRIRFHYQGGWDWYWGIDDIIVSTCGSPTASISGNVNYCTNPANPVIPGVTMTLSGTSAGMTSTDGSGNYTFSGLATGGATSYTVVPSKAALAPGVAGINGGDFVKVLQHVLTLIPITAPCELVAADADTTGTPGAIDGSDLVAILRFFLTFANQGNSRAGTYNFNPASIVYSPLSGDQTNQNYSTRIYGDPSGTNGYVHRPVGASDDSARISTVEAVTLPTVALDASKSNQVAPVTTTAIQASENLVAFQGDFTFDERVVTFDENRPVQPAGLTSSNWNVVGHVLPGAGPIRTLRVFGYSNDVTALTGKGTLFELRIDQVKAGQSTALVWAPDAQSLLFIQGGADVTMHAPVNAAAGSITTIPTQR